MGGRGSWSESSETYTPIPGSGGKQDDESLLAPRVPATLAEALGQKGKPMSEAKASVGTNPHYDPNYNAYSSNCQRCVLTYEARRRGYDVTALPTYSTDLLPRNGDYLRALSNPKVVDVNKSVKKLNKEMQSYGDGARAIVRVAKNGEGHVFIAENKRGKIEFIDPQINGRYNKLSLSKVSRAQVVRIDNQQFTEYARNAFTRQKV